MTCLKARAKVNLFFQIIGKNQSNYHLIESLVVFTNDIYDLVEVTPSKDNKTTVTGGIFLPQLVDEPNNLIDKVLPFADNQQRFQCNLTKNIPIGAGLGGGSSDAAIVAKYISRNNLSEKLASIGADLPVCYFANPAYCEGIGEVLTPVNNLPSFYLVLVYPNSPLLTKDVFLRNTISNTKKIINKPIDFLNDFYRMMKFILDLKNDLSEAAISLMPEIKYILNLLEIQDNCYLARMSGSGPTCFGIFETEEFAKKAKNNIKNAHPEYWVEYSQV